MYVKQVCLTLQSLVFVGGIWDCPDYHLVQSICNTENMNQVHQHNPTCPWFHKGHLAESLWSLPFCDTSLSLLTFHSSVSLEQRIAVSPHRQASAVFGCSRQRYVYRERKTSLLRHTISREASMKSQLYSSGGWLGTTGCVSSQLVPANAFWLPRGTSLRCITLIHH